MNSACLITYFWTNYEAPSHLRFHGNGFPECIAQKKFVDIMFCGIVKRSLRFVTISWSLNMVKVFTESLTLLKLNQWLKVEMFKYILPLNILIQNNNSMFCRAMMFSQSYWWSCQHVTCLNMLAFESFLCYFCLKKLS